MVISRYPKINARYATMDGHHPSFSNRFTVISTLFVHHIVLSFLKCVLFRAKLIAKIQTQRENIPNDEF
jgi:hypothetical protein